MRLLVGVSQVLDLEVTRTLVHRLVQVFLYVCADCTPLLRTTTAVYRAVNKLIRELNRRSTRVEGSPGVRFKFFLLSNSLYSRSLSPYISARTIRWRSLKCTVFRNLVLSVFCCPSSFPVLAAL